MTAQRQIDQDSRFHAELEALCARTIRAVPDNLKDGYNSYVHGLWENVSLDDLLADAATRQDLRVQGLWQWGRTRQPGEMHLRVYNPPEQGSAWRQECSHIDLISDDMPFLVDSLAVELDRLNIPVRLLLHPVYSVSRDDAGNLTRLQRPRTGEMKRESWMHISIERQPSEALDGIRALLLKVLADVRLAVTDWKAMRTAIRQTVSDISSAPPPGVAAELVKESQQFLEWLDDDHFVFLGYRDYQLSADGNRLEVDLDHALGLLRDGDLVVLRGLRRFDLLPEKVQSFLCKPEVVFVNKAQARSSVHRAVPYDIVGIKRFAADGTFMGLRIFIGLHTSVAYSRNAEDIPLLRLKMQQVIERSGIDPHSHSGKALVHILNTYPRDDLFQIDVEQLYAICRGVLLLAERLRTALFVWRDPFNRFVSCLIYTPRERFDTTLRHQFTELLEQAWRGRASSFSTGFTDSPLVRLQLTIDLEDGANTPSPDLADLEKRLIALARGWDDGFVDAVMAKYGPERGSELRARYAQAFPASYKASLLPELAVEDVDLLERVQGEQPLALMLRPVDGQSSAMRLRLFHQDAPVALSDVLPQLENMGLRIVSEVPHCITPSSGAMVWISELLAESRDGSTIALESVNDKFLQAFDRLWDGALEDDRFNQLVLRLGLNWREVTMLRAYAKYLQQARFHPTPSFIRDTLATHGELTRQMVALFHARLDPAAQNMEQAEKLAATIRASLDSVTSLAEDEVLRRYLNLIENTLRTNYYQTTADGAPKPYISFKLDSQKLTDLPRPRPLVEIWVYGPRVEGVHLRGGRVARGGIRWSDRRDDFRTEILGLMKAQMVKNAVIVPTGSKGGFYCKRLPADKAAEGKEVIACYQTFIRGLLDLTDNRLGNSVIPPKDCVRHDGDDPYLVVAADKGTAKFSDIANALSLDYGFWLGDGFASGGSAGYDHKHMGITARGAWEAVKRHFRELGKDIQNEAFTCIGVGDMAGDVFGNGLLRSRHTLLVAAFNHKHIFLDPNPDAATSFAERQRLFDLPGSQWSDYAADRISTGGGVYERSAKSITLSPEVQVRFGLNEDKMAPADLVRALLKSKVDLLYLGGIGTFVKATSESHEDANDRANDALRVNAAELGASVVGEGANLGITARARIEAGRAGIRLNSDAIDNSAGVDTSDHEVNIKIALQPQMANMTLTKAARDTLLASMTDEVAALVLRDNYLQTQALSLEQRQAVTLLDQHARLIETFEKAGRLDRAVEFLPSAGQISQRATAGEGLTRPELALLLAHAKIALCDALVRSSLPDDPAVEADLLGYFPTALQQGYAPALKAHRLRREIIATVLANDIVNRMGITFTRSLAERMGKGQDEVVRAYLVIREAAHLPAYWAAVEALDNKITAQTQMDLLEAGRAFAARAISSLLHGGGMGASPLTELQAQLSPQLAGLTAQLPRLLPEEDSTRLTRQAALWGSQGIPVALATQAARFQPLAAGPDILQIATRAGVEADKAARVYYEVGQRFRLEHLRQAASAAKASSYWQRQLALSLLEELYAVQQQISGTVLTTEGGLSAFLLGREAALIRLDDLLDEVCTSETLDLAMVAMASRALWSMA